MDDLTGFAEAFITEWADQICPREKGHLSSHRPKPHRKNAGTA